MTDPHDPLDDLASDHLDGRTTPAEDERIQADPELTARVERLRTTRGALRAMAAEPVDAHQRDTAIDAALAAFDDAAEPEGAAGATVTALSQVTPRRGMSRRTLWLSGVAAAVVLVALTIPFLGSLDSGTSDDQASSDASSTLEADDRAQEGAAGGSAPDEALSATAGSLPTADLGAFTDLRSLTDAVRAQPISDRAAAMTAESAADTPGGARPCASRSDAEEGTVTYTAVASLRGQPVVLVVREAGERRTLDVLDAGDCTTIAVEPL